MTTGHRHSRDIQHHRFTENSRRMVPAFAGTTLGKDNDPLR
jgi:hypothetical protein